jgi:TRAP-type C4-dicarboxylate transport system permease small subunit
MWADRLWRAYGLLLRTLAMVAAGLVALMLVGIAVDVFLRNLFVSGIRGVVEYTEFGLYLSVILVAPWLLHQGQHIRADLLGQFGSGAWLRVVDALAEATGLVVSLIVFWYALWSTIDSYSIGSMVRKAVSFPEWLLIAPLVGVMALLVVEFAFRLRRCLTQSTGRHEDVRSVA